MDKETEFFVEAIRRACERMGYAMQVLSEGWVIEVANGSVRRRIINRTFDLNLAASQHIATDKVACYELLRAHDVAAVPHYLAYPAVVNREKLVAQLGGSRVVVKPLTGGGGRGVILFETANEALDYVSHQHESSALSVHHDIVSETRAIVLDGEVLVSYAKTNPRTVNGLVFHNLSQGATPQVRELSGDEKGLVHAAMNALGLHVAAVDVAELADGSRCIMEVNSSIAMARFAEHSAKYREIAYDAYGQIVQHMME